MGVVYTIACTDCKVSRDVGKLRCAWPAKTKQDIIELAEQIKEDTLRVALVMSFLNDHQEHLVIFGNDSSGSEIWEYDSVNPDSGYTDSGVT